MRARSSKKPLEAHPRPHLRSEYKFGYPSAPIAGIDEVGRGCLAGPVVAACLVLPERIRDRDRKWLREVRDSKLLISEKREELFDRLSTWALDIAVAWATPAEIDSINILRASHLAMERAVQSLKRKPEGVLVDGPFIPKGFPEGLRAQAIIRGDAQSISIAGASIIAKVWRDGWMREQDERYPGYGFSSHKGYGTPAHREALRALGPCPLHRMSFGPVLASGGEDEFNDETELYGSAQ